jgi:hypothetical protein
MAMTRFPSMVLLVTVVATSARAAAPRVFLLDGKQLAETKQKLAAGDATLRPALEQLKRDTSDAMKEGPWSVVQKGVTSPSGDKHDYMSQAPYWWPDPAKADGLPYVRRDGERNPEIYKITDRTAMKRMSQVAQTLALAYYFTGDETYASRAGELLRTWFLAPQTRMNPHLEYAQGIPGINAGRGIGIIETGDLTNVVDAVGLLEGSKALSGAERAAMREWFSAYLKWMLESANGKEEAAAKNNHGTHYDLQAATFALFTDQPNVARRILNEVPAKRIAVQVEPDGRQPLELDRTKAWSYSIMNARGLMQLARLGQHVNVDLWNARTEDGRSIRAALDFLLPYATGEKVWPHEQINGFRPEGAITLLRRAARVYPDGPYSEAVAKLPPLAPTHLDHLTGPRLVANEADSR